MSKIIEALKFLNMLEARYNKISLSNLAVIVCIVKVAIAPAASIVDLSALLLALLNYGHKRYESNKSAANTSEASVAELRTAMERVVGVQNNLTTDIATFKRTFDDVAKTAEESKKLLSTSTLASAFKR